jgi:vanillate O-demethylase monooxygenase subunit
VYLRNAWYCAGWAKDLGEKPLGRTMLGEYVVFYRDSRGEPVAMGGRCPHRFAPLDRGTVIGDAIMCPYHGLQYGKDGACILNPHGAIPATARLKTYTILERHGTLWIWMGDSKPADRELLPSDEFLADSRYSCMTGYLKVSSNYQLIIDNLLDLTHGPFLHAKTLLAPPPGLEDVDWTKFAGEIEHKFSIQGTTIHSDYRFPNSPRPGGVHPKYPELIVDAINDMTWMPGANLRLDTRMVPLATGGNIGLHMPTCHYIVPETEFTSHYFVAVGRDFMIDDADEDARMINLVLKAFSEEDEPILQACQTLMGPVSDLFSLKPVILKTDRAAVHARQILTKLIHRERDTEIHTTAAPLSVE